MVIEVCRVLGALTWKAVLLCKLDLFRSEGF